jgi:hypothetical protein
VDDQCPPHGEEVTAEEASAEHADPHGRGSDPTGEAARPGWQRHLARLARLRSPSPRVRALLMVVAGLGVAVGVVWSIDRLEVSLADLRLVPLLALVLVLSPATIWANAAELRIMTRVVSPQGRPMGWALALRTVLVATAANLLPLPAGAVVRIQAMRTEGVGTVQATSVNVVGAGAWIAAGLLVAALAALGAAPPAPVALALAVGLAGFAVAGVLAARLATRSPGRAAASLLGIETVTAVVHGVRLYVVLLALGLDVTLAQGLALGAATPLAAAAGVFPSGIGLAEALTALIAPLVALPAAAGFAATAIGRVVGLLVIAPLALAVGARDLRDARRVAARQADGAA